MKNKQPVFIRLKKDGSVHMRDCIAFFPSKATAIYVEKGRKTNDVFPGCQFYGKIPKWWDVVGCIRLWRSINNLINK